MLKRINVRGKARRAIKSILALPLSRQVNQRRGNRPQQHFSLCENSTARPPAEVGGDGVALRDVVGDGVGDGNGDGEGDVDGEDLPELFKDVRPFLKELFGCKHLPSPPALCSDGNDADLGSPR